MTYQQGSSVVDLDLATGVATTRFPGVAPNRAPDGSTIVLDGKHLVLVAVDGNTRTPLVDDCNPGAPQACSGAVMSGDGSQFAYHGACTEDKCHGAGMGAVVRNRRGELAQFFPDMSPEDWFPDGRLLLTVPASSKDPGVYVAPKDLSKPALVNSAVLCSHARVSPDGKSIACEWKGHIWLMGADGTGAVQVTNSTGQESYPTWAPDGQTLLVEFDGTEYFVFPTGQQRLPLRRSDGSQVTLSGPTTWR
ncbi:MAG: PD40 domain-containing protein [Chloroflexi bacterium]|nr:PD40 domain-containing protein [Chloroflexota bacterium]